MATRPRNAKQLTLAAKTPPSRGSQGDAHQRAMTRAGRWLALRPRTVAEMRARLGDGGFDPKTVEGAITRLLELRVLDDLAFAQQLVEERSRKGVGPKTLRAELEAKGIDAHTAEAALEGI
ncbi:MAG: regulatory protein RecX, partial [Actinomycetota bacterium]